MRVNSRRATGLLSTGVFLAAVAGVLGCAGLGRNASFAPVSSPAAASFPPERIRAGERLAAVGDCASCHTMRSGASFAGGVPVPTPFGTIYGTNITPDAETGIGSWSQDAFRRALRQGISRDGHYLYPAFPYDHFTHLSDDDIAALYAYLMTRDAVHATAPPNKMMFPFQFRPLVAAWNALYLHEGPLPAPAAQDPRYARGAYLVEGAAHCAACHSPRNALGAEEHGRFLDGGDAEGWHATALNRKSPSPVPWDAQSLAAYLRAGLVPGHALTAGPMRDVVHSLSHADPADVDAIAVFVAGVMGPADAPRQSRERAARERSTSPLAQQPVKGGGDAATLTLGRSVYEGSCAQCHDAGRGLSSDSALQLPLAVALHMPDPRNFVHIVRDGIEPANGEAGRWMPPFAGNLSNDQITALAIWLRHQATDEPPWHDVAKAVKESEATP